MKEIKLHRTKKDENGKRYWTIEFKVNGVTIAEYFSYKIQSFENKRQEFKSHLKNGTLPKVNTDSGRMFMMFNSMKTS